ncbi:hypothetical protein VTO42DRAFT_3270 [Malbranchea cinnamomea]
MREFQVVFGCGPPEFPGLFPGVACCRTFQSTWAGNTYDKARCKEEPSWSLGRGHSTTPTGHTQVNLLQHCTPLSPKRTEMPLERCQRKRPRMGFHMEDLGSSNVRCSLYGPCIALFSVLLHPTAPVWACMDGILVEVKEQRPPGPAHGPFLGLRPGRLRATQPNEKEKKEARNENTIARFIDKSLVAPTGRCITAIGLKEKKKISKYDYPALLLTAPGWVVNFHAGQAQTVEPGGRDEPRAAPGEFELSARRVVSRRLLNLGGLLLHLVHILSTLTHIPPSSHSSIPRILPSFPRLSPLPLIQVKTFCFGPWQSARIDFVLAAGLSLFIPFNLVRRCTLLSLFLPLIEPFFSPPSSALLCLPIQHRSPLPIGPCYSSRIEAVTNPLQHLSRSVALLLRGSIVSLPRPILPQNKTGRE